MKNKPFPALFLLLLAALLVICAAAPARASGALSGIKICLDPGHGGSDPGAVNSDFALNESDINLDVSFGLKYLLEGEGAEVSMTRVVDVFLTNEDRYTFCNAQQATILISVHTNSVTDPTWDGSMALYAPNRDPDLAQAIYEIMFPLLRDTAPDGVTDFRDFGLDNFASGVLFKCTMPAAMMEPLLMSHPAEAALLQTAIMADPETGLINAGCAGYSCRRGQIAQAIYLGTLNYFESQAAHEIHVAAVDMSYSKRGATYLISTAVTIQDSAGQAVPDAAVTIELTQPDSTKATYTAATGAEGTAVFKNRVKAAGLYETAVIDVVKASWTYDQTANLADGAQLSIP